MPLVVLQFSCSANAMMMPSGPRITEAKELLVLVDLADEFAAVGVQAGNNVVDVFDGEHDAPYPQRVRRCRFAAAHGFTVLQRSRTFRLEGGTQPGHDDFIVETKPDPASVAAAFRDFYVSSHGWDPAGPMTVEDITGTHIAEASAAILVRSPAGEALAAGCLYDEGDDAPTLSGGPTDPSDPRSQAAVTALLDGAPKPVLVEVDDSVPALLAALALRDATCVEEVHIVAEA